MLTSRLGSALEAVNDITGPEAEGDAGAIAFDPVEAPQEHGRPGGQVQL